MPQLLIVDDEPSTLSVLTTLLKAEGYDVTSALGGEKASEVLRAEHFDLMLSDIRMSPVDGMTLLRQAHDECPAMSVIMLTAYGSVATAIEALKLGAFDYVTKPFKVDELIYTIKRALEYHRAITENADLKAQLGTLYRLENIIAESTAMKNVCEMIKRVAPTDATVLITGESGTGKEVVAKALHACSRRHDKNFLPVNCAALPEALLESEMFGHVKGSFTGATHDKEGLFEAAHGGTIFLDEIGSVPLNIQGKLLRVLQEREIRRVGSNENIPVDARVVAATNTPLKILMEQGKFREDLYYRLRGLPIELPPLRERGNDILILANHFTEKFCTENEMPLKKLSQNAQQKLLGYPFPGNIRELKSVVELAVTLSESVTVEPEDIILDPGNPLSEVMNEELTLKQYELKIIKAMLRKHDNDIKTVATRLDIGISTIYRLLREEKQP